jgi:A/G-specific adenine glycosylase
MSTDMLTAVDTDTIAWFRRRLKAWGRINYRSFPWRETDDPFKVLIAEVLLQRSRGRTVAHVYEALFARWPDAKALSTARVPSIASVIRPLGLVRRAATLKSLASEILRRGDVPADIGALMALPGVGRYAASATLAVAFGRSVPTVDGVTARVYRRFFGLRGNEPASGMELGGAGSSGYRLSPQGSEVRGVSTRQAVRVVKEDSVDQVGVRC